MLQVLTVTRSSWVFAVSKRCGEAERALNHLHGDALAELLHISLDVLQEGITAPTSKEHDDINGDALQDSIVNGD
jgi:hypothetical protein